MSHYLALPDGTTIWPLDLSRGPMYSTSEVTVILTDGTEQQHTVRTNHDPGVRGQWGWISLPPGVHPTAVEARSTRTEVIGYQLVDPAAESERYPARLTAEQYQQRVAWDDDLDDDVNEARVAVARAMYVSEGTVTVPYVRGTIDGLDSWQQVKAPTTDWLDPYPAEPWLPNPMGRVLGPAWSWLFPGSVALPDALQRALRELNPRMEIHRRDYDSTTQFSCWFDLAYDPPRTTTETTGKGRRKTVREVPAVKRVHREFRVPNWVAGHDKAHAVVTRVKVIEELIAEHVPFAVVCSHCNGEGWITTTTKREDTTP